MNISKNNKVRAVDLRMTAKRFYVLLEDGREIGIPYSWFHRLERATEEQRKNWRLIGQGEGIHWEEIDEDISVERLLVGVG